MMTRKHFEMIAASIKAEVDRLRAERDLFNKQGMTNRADSRVKLENGVYLATCRIAQAFAKENPRFDHRRFLTACGFDQ